jgi:hypothetical protein
METDFPAAHSMDTTWFGVDRAGHVALFETGEDGHAPDLAQEEEFLQELWTFFQTDKAGADDDAFIEAREEDDIPADLGLFCYSYSGFSLDYGEEFVDAVLGTYEQDFRPEVPLHIDQLPPELRRACWDMPFKNVDFSEAKVLQPLEHFGCFWLSDYKPCAYLLGDEKTVRPLRGAKPERFRALYLSFCKAHPRLAKKLRFEGLEEPEKKRPARKRKKET